MSRRDKSKTHPGPLRTYPAAGPLIALLLATFAAGCASQSPPPERPQPPPAPASFKISGSLAFNLPKRFSLETGLPESLNGKISVEARAETLSVTPLSSHYNGQLQMTLTDGEGKTKLADTSFHVEGTTDGSPSNALAETVQRIVDAYVLASRGIPTSPAKSAPVDVTIPPSTRP